MQLHFSSRHLIKCDGKGLTRGRALETAGKVGSIFCTLLLKISTSYCIQQHFVSDDIHYEHYHSDSEATTSMISLPKLVCYLWLFSGEWGLHYFRAWTTWASSFLTHEEYWRQHPRVKWQLRDAGVDLGCIYSSALPSSHVGPLMLSAWLLKLLPSQAHSRQRERQSWKASARQIYYLLWDHDKLSRQEILTFIDQNLGTGLPSLPGSMGEVQLRSDYIGT